MVKLRRIFVPLLLALSLLASCDEGNSHEEEEDSITIALCETNLENSAFFLKQYALKYPKVKFNIDVYDCNSLKYKSNHKKIDADIILLDDLSTVNRLSDSLIDFTYSEALNNYSRYTTNFLKNSDDGRVYGLPSPGGLYAYAVNLDLINKYNLVLPNTIDKLVDFSNEIKNYVTPFVSTFTDAKYFLDAFMQTCIPSFFATVNGQTMFDELSSGKTKLADSKYVSAFSDSLANLYNLTASSFFDGKIGRLNGIERFFAGKAAILSIMPGFEFEEYYKNYGSTFEYTFMPLVGRKSSNNWVCSISDSYLAVPKEKYVGNKTKIIDAFIDLFSSSEGQGYLVCDENGIKRPHHFSYVNDSVITDEDGRNKMLNEAISQGRVFLIDKLYPTFSPNASSFEEYASDEIDAKTVIDDIDYNNEARISQNTRYYDVPSLSDGGEENIKTFMNNLRMISANIRSEKKLDVFFVNENFLTEPIYDSLIYEHELELIFDGSVFCTEVRVKGNILKDILDFCLSNNGAASSENKVRKTTYDKYYQDQENVTLAFKESISLNSQSFFVSGALIANEDGNKKYTLTNNNEINDERSYFIAVPTAFVRDRKFDFEEIGTAFSCLEAYKSYLENSRV